MYLTLPYSFVKALVMLTVRIDNHSVATLRVRKPIVTHILDTLVDLSISSANLISPIQRKLYMF